MKKPVKIVLMAICVLGIAGFVIYSMASPMSVDLVELSPTTARLSFTERGVYAYQESYTLFPLMPGEIVKLAAAQGDEVSAGDLIVVIEAADLEFEIARLESTIAAGQARQAQARELEQQQRQSLIGSRRALEGQIIMIEAQRDDSARREDSREAQLEYQLHAVRENRRLVSYASRALGLAEDTDDNNYILAAQTNLAQARQLLASSEIMLEQMRTPGMGAGFFDGQIDSIIAEIDTINARLGVDYSISAVRALEAEIDAVHTQIEQLRHMQGRSQMNTPVNGVITNLHAANSNIAAQGTPIATIEWDPMVEVYVSTRDIESISEGDTVMLTIERRMGDRQISGRIIHIENEAVARLSPLGVEERGVKLLIRPDEQGFIMGGSMDVSFSIFERENSIIIPKTALFRVGGQYTVWVVRGGVLEQASVQRGIELREGYLIEAGLYPGDIIVRDANTQGLAEGRRVAG